MRTKSRKVKHPRREVMCKTCRKIFTTGSSKRHQCHTCLPKTPNRGNTFAHQRHKNQTTTKDRLGMLGEAFPKKDWDFLQERARKWENSREVEVSM